MYVIGILEMKQAVQLYAVSAACAKEVFYLPVYIENCNPKSKDYIVNTSVLLDGCTSKDLGT